MFLLEADQDSRATATDALQHEWISVSLWNSFDKIPGLRPNFMNTLYSVQSGATKHIKSFIWINATL